MTKLKQYTLAGFAEKITRPFLVTHCEHDTILPAAYGQLLYDSVDSNKSIKIFFVEEGGSNLVQGDIRVLGSNYVADWLADNLWAGGAVPYCSVTPREGLIRRHGRTSSPFLALPY